MTKTLPKLELCCTDDDLRPALQHVLVTKSDVVATDAHILVVHKTADLFTAEFIDKMPERMLIHKKLWIEMRKKHLRIEFHDGNPPFKVIPSM